MDDDIRPAKAVEIICSAIGCSPLQGRKILIAALARGEIASWAESYWRVAHVEGRSFNPGGYQGGDEMVPIDFWQPGHERHRDLSPNRGSTKLPAGSGGDFNIGRFRTALSMTATACAHRFQNWWAIEEFGDAPAWLEWEALGLTIDQDEVQDLAGRMDLLAITEPFFASPIGRPGPASRDDIERWRAVAILMARHSPAERFQSREVTFRWLRDVATDICGDGIDDNTVRRLATFIAAEAPKYVEDTDAPID